MAENTATKKSTSKKSTPAKKTAPKKTVTKAAEPTDLVIPVEAPSGVRVGLGDQVYTVRPIKTTLGMALANNLQGLKEDPKELEQAMDKLISMIFYVDDREGVKARLNDADDALDYNHIMKLLTALMERATGNPITSPSA